MLPQMRLRCVLTAANIKRRYKRTTFVPLSQLRGPEVTNMHRRFK